MVGASWRRKRVFSVDLAARRTASHSDSLTDTPSPTPKPQIPNRQLFFPNAGPKSKKMLERFLTKATRRKWHAASPHRQQHHPIETDTETALPAKTDKE